MNYDVFLSFFLILKEFVNVQEFLVELTVSTCKMLKLLIVGLVSISFFINCRFRRLIWLLETNMSIPLFYNSLITNTINIKPLNIKMCY